MDPNIANSFSNNSTFYIVIFVVLIIGLRMLRGAKARRLRIERMWIGPAIFALLLGSIIYSDPPPLTPGVMASLGAATCIGAGLGWLRGRMVRVSIDVSTHELTSQTSPWGLLIFAGLILVRMGLRAFLTQHAADWHIPLAALTDGFILFYAGMVCSRSLEVFIRARRLLENARIARAAGEKVPDEISEDHA